ncbi:hypothetical protein [Virgibacillus halodenitrificans]|uniref:hypothetical protein n=1 Tax=Virgibacillus halodenitrificans TaxID=1482 RepID=UPI0002DDCFEE|nr:hypothetical protein [Virgibacillus halodenitrificans]
MVLRTPEAENKDVDFIISANKVITKVTREVEKHHQGIRVDGTISHLKTVLIELEKMKEQLDNKKFTPTYPIFITDSWSFNSDLGIQLLKLNEEYKKLN